MRLVDMRFRKCQAGRYYHPQYLSKAFPSSRRLLGLEKFQCPHRHPRRHYHRRRSQTAPAEPAQRHRFLGKQQHAASCAGGLAAADQTHPWERLDPYPGCRETMALAANFQRRHRLLLQVQRPAVFARASLLAAQCNFSGGGFQFAFYQSTLSAGLPFGRIVLAASFSYLYTVLQPP